MSLAFRRQGLRWEMRQYDIQLFFWTKRACRRYAESRGYQAIFV